jgi:sialidase-1
MRKIYLLTISILLTALLAGCSGDDHNMEIPGIDSIGLKLKKVPLFIERDNQGILEITLIVSETEKPPGLKTIELFIQKNSHPEIISSITADYIVKDGEDISKENFGTSDKTGNLVKIPGNRLLEPGEHTFHININVPVDAALEKSILIEKVRLDFGGRQRMVIEPEENFAYRPGVVLRAAGQDNCDTYRIPGIITTGKGTLIAVYDNRYNNSKDLQEDVDIGMSRSIDGGQTWEPMRVIMDMGEWGGRSERLNGIGDPAVLYDHTTGTIWVAALWMSGSSPDQMLWWASKPGMSPEETGQFILAKSTDDGLTWSEPINITEQIKDPTWQLLLQGPGAGITLNDGTLVFPAQFKADIGEKALDGGQYTCHSTIIYSKDGGKTWHIGTGAKPNTTEAQVVQLTDGSLMLNMRDDLNRRVKDETNGRAVSVTKDLGQTWTTHPTSNSTLQEPNCMASIIGADLTVNGSKQRVLFFSNPNNKNSRTNMTIKTSLDEGNTWPENLQVELYAPAGFGYSCLTMVDENNVGIVYEGVKELYFQKVPVSDLLKSVIK